MSPYRVALPAHRPSRTDFSSRVCCCTGEHEIIRRCVTCLHGPFSTAATVRAAVSGACRRAVNLVPLRRHWQSAMSWDPCRLRGGPGGFNAGRLQGRARNRQAPSPVRCRTVAVRSAPFRVLPPIRVAAVEARGAARSRCPGAQPHVQAAAATLALAAGTVRPGEDVLRWVGAWQAVSGR